jgi:hypothetical protein
VFHCASGRGNTSGFRFEGQYICVYWEGDLKGSEYKIPFSNQITVPKICPEGVRKTTNIFNQNGNALAKIRTQHLPSMRLERYRCANRLNHRDDGKSKFCRNMRKASTLDEVSLRVPKLPRVQLHPRSIRDRISLPAVVYGCETRSVTLRACPLQEKRLPSISGTSWVHISTWTYVYSSVYGTYIHEPSYRARARDSTVGSAVRRTKTKHGTIRVFGHKGEKR